MRRLIADAADLTRPMTINFQIDCPDLASAEAIAAKVPPAQFAIILFTVDAGVQRIQIGRDEWLRG